MLGNKRATKKPPRGGLEILTIYTANLPRRAKQETQQVELSLNFHALSLAIDWQCVNLSREFTAVCLFKNAGIKSKFN